MPTTPAHQRLSQLLDYVVEQSRNVDPLTFNLTRMSGFVYAGQAIASMPGVETNLDENGDPVWLRVPRLGKTTPALDDPHRLLVGGDDPRGEPPTLNDEAWQAHAATTFNEGANRANGALAAHDSPDARAWLDAWRAEQTIAWKAWAVLERQRRLTMQFYQRLFEVKQVLDHEDTGKPQELVIGVGVAAQRLMYAAPKGAGGAAGSKGAAGDAGGEGSTAGTSSGGAATTGWRDVQYPLFTQAVQVTMNPANGTLDVRPRLVQPRVEMEAYALAKVPGAALVETRLKKDLALIPDALSPFAPTVFGPLLSAAASRLDAQGHYAEGETAWPAPQQHLTVSDAWVLMVRPRSANYLHEDIARIQAALREPEQVLPAGAGALVTPPDDRLIVDAPMLFRGRSGLSGDTAYAGKPHELYFPLPYNREQVSIVERLERADGMTVQGPPGTGKTHTIANIVCHYLATGRKVLVTSKGEKALTVLQDKIPAQVRPLTVALLSDDKVGARQFQASIDTIMLNVSQMNPAMMRDEIRGVEQAIDQVHGQLAMVDRRLNEIAHQQLSEVMVQGQPWKAHAMADLVVHGDALYGWLDDELSLDDVHTPPFADSDAAELRRLRRRLGEDLLTLNDRLPSSARMPGTADVRTWHEALKDQALAQHDEQHGRLWPLRQADATRDRSMAALAERLEHTVQAWAGLQAAIDAGESWIPGLRTLCRDPSYTGEIKALEALFKSVETLVAQREHFLQVPVELPEGAVKSSAFAEAVARAEQTGKAFGMFSWGDSEVKAMVNAVKVSGAAPASTQDWHHVSAYLKLHSTLRTFVARWNHLVEDLGLPTLGSGLKALRRVEVLVRLVREVHQLAVTIDAPALQLAQEVFQTPDLSVIVGPIEGVKALHDQLVRRLREPVQRAAHVAVAQWRMDWTNARGLVAHDVQAWLSTQLGHPAKDSVAVVQAYADLVERVQRWEGLGEAFGTLSALIDAVERAGAIRWAQRLRTVVSPAAGDDPVFPNDWQSAWTYARFKTYLNSIEARHEMMTLSSERGQLEQGLAGLYEKLVAKTAWLSTKMNATPKVLAALETYQTAVRHIGKGTGVNAPRHRRDAQQAMKEAQSAIPCWIMSHAKVSESLPSDLGSFDLVIVDEASQSDLGSLPSILRGKKILVVGDDKQVSPSATTVAAEQVQSLRERFLTDQPYAAMLTPEKSLYEITKAVFAGHSVMLREHFRCVPAIVEYSNKTFYDGGIQPLRIPKASERLDPPLVDWFVPVGVRTKDLNVSEAECITAEIVALLADPRFDGKSIGVVSLQGMDQAQLIDSMVRERCDAHVLEQRHFDCGTARLFQGGERDIMFLSMVVDPNNVHAATKKSDEQVFNVAATRARDRMYLVRSVGLNDLSPTSEDLRKGLIQHFKEPLLGTVEAPGTALIERCESGFERQVYTELVQRGYRVIPQVKAGGFRLDMVVEGERDARLAIECDGDAFHGPADWEHDVARQRVLERAGWIFWRCFASTWALHRDEVVHELLERLKALAIEPLGALEQLPSLTEYREWTQVPHTDVLTKGAIKAAKADSTQMGATDAGGPAGAKPARKPRAKKGVASAVEGAGSSTDVPTTITATTMPEPDGQPPSNGATKGSDDKPWAPPLSSTQQAFFNGDLGSPKPPERPSGIVEVGHRLFDE